MAYNISWDFIDYDLINLYIFLITQLVIPEDEVYSDCTCLLLDPRDINIRIGDDGNHEVTYYDNICLYKC
jgi:hypothetical protein